MDAPDVDPAARGDLVPQAGAVQVLHHQVGLTVGRDGEVALEEFAQSLEALVVFSDVEVRNAGLAAQHSADVRVEDELRELATSLERRVEERTRDLEASNRALVRAVGDLEAFCYSVSHDLRTPLRAIDGFSQELLAGYSDRLDDTGRHYLNRVRNGTQRTGMLIDDLLKLSRVGRADLHRETVDLTAMAAAVGGFSPR